MSLYSYHVFLFPFQWELRGERFDFKCINNKQNGKWQNVSEPKIEKYKVELYNEKNFFYKFVHGVLYDTGDDTGENENPIRHYERNEAYTSELFYEIGVKSDSSDVYKLPLISIGLNLYSTGTGLLMFYIKNESYPDLRDIKRINQFGRRIFPPFLTNIDGINGTKESELADYIKIIGLAGDPDKYMESFESYSTSDDWKPAKFIISLIKDLDPDFKIEPVIDDRMFTMCWFFDDSFSEEIKKDTLNRDKWYKYLFIDKDQSTCQNEKMTQALLEKHSYNRWQNQGTLYGITRYSFVAISEYSYFTENVLLTTFRTMYVRMVELSLLYRSSILKFSAEVTKLSTLRESDNSKLAKEISKFYRQYIRFVNQVFFREITAQDQGIELYEMLLKILNINEQVKDLDNEINELYNYASQLDERSQSSSLRLLTVLSGLFLAPTFIASFFGMNYFGQPVNIWSFLTVIVGMILVPILIYALISNKVFKFSNYFSKEPRAWIVALSIIILLITIALGIINFPICTK